MKCTAIVLAAGQGKRMNSKIQKQFLNIQGFPVLYYSLKCFQECSWMDDIILVTGEGEQEYCRKEIVEKYNITKVSNITAGGKERYHSVWNGLKACTDTEYVFIHDGARPFITQEILERGLDCVREWEACAAGMPSKDTVKIVDEKGIVCSTPQRNYVWNVQTPQVFQYALVSGAYKKAMEGDCSQITDDAMVVERYADHPVMLYKGSYENIKITTPEDLGVAEVFAHNI
ncbi:MAG: 2-C-methyl-D-erythritol 4-phosphate cytidylyltransferase [Clostridia bacterium]|nr:2-C-methyl-D-erythritol 4-phosphate cytidylyltransferase [Clostridia bacterium]NCC44577.1 2-C-methyl-D-erythritol 4-phosphate cytidylyltransferase [Clostridia bacterium]